MVRDRMFSTLHFLFVFWVSIFESGPVPDSPSVPTIFLVPCMPPSLGRLCARPYGWALCSASRVRRISLAFSAAACSPRRTLLPQPRPTFDEHGRAAPLVASRALLRPPTLTRKFRVGLRVGAMQASRWQRVADARRPHWYIQAGQHGGYLGGVVHRKAPPFSSTFMGQLTRCFCSIQNSGHTCGCSRVRRRQR